VYESLSRPVEPEVALKPANAAQEPVNHGDGRTPLFAYGFGLTY